MVIFPSRSHSTLLYTFFYSTQVPITDYETSRCFRHNFLKPSTGSLPLKCQWYCEIINHHHRLYSPGWALASSWGFVTIFFFFCGVRLLASRPTPNLEGQGIPCCLGHDLSGMGGPTSSIRYYQHSSWDHMTTQAPPLSQSKGYLWGVIVSLGAVNIPDTLTAVVE